MQYSKFSYPIFLSACFLFACSGHSAAGKDGPSTNPTEADASASSSPSSSAGNASFSCKIDGKDFSGQGTDNMANAAMKLDRNILNFVLMPIIAGQTGIPPQLAFHVADKGTTTIHGTDNPDYSVSYSPANTVDNSDQCKEMTVTITSSGASRVTGTFSGTLTEPKTDRAIPVTDGKFDIPYSTYSKK